MAEEKKIEVEIKFQPAEEQLTSLLKNAEHISNEKIHDIYYDFSDFRFLKQKIRLRDRNGSFELKIRVDSNVDKEIDDKEEIERYLKLDVSLEEFINKELGVIIEYGTERKKYKKEGFTICLDKMSFDYSMCEVELMVEKEEQAKEAKEKIMNFAKEYDFEEKKGLSKGAEYLRRFNPEKYKEIYIDKKNEENGEKKNGLNNEMKIR